MGLHVALPAAREKRIYRGGGEGEGEGEGEREEAIQEWFNANKCWKGYHHGSGS